MYIVKKWGFITPWLPASSFICTALLLFATVFIHLSGKVDGSSLAAYATVWLRGIALSTLAQQHAYITEHVLGVIQCASVYSGVITRLSSSMFTATLCACCPLLLFTSPGKGISEILGAPHAHKWHLLSADKHLPQRHLS